jgi:ParB family chromosome partitioning protein
LSKGNAVDLGLKTAFDELFMSDAGRAENRLPKIYDIPLTEIDDFPEHPFKVMLDEDMDQLVQSIKERGIITPITLRQKEDGRYEIVSGHRRKKACELAGLETVKSEIKELTRDEAIILMVESNYQRSSILPSEKAFAYKMRLEAMKRQGQRSDLTLSPVETKLRTSEMIAQSSGDSRAQVDRYIRLTELSSDLLNMVDENKIAFRPAVELSYLKEDEQKSLVEAMTYADATPSLAQAIKMKEFSKNGKLTPEVMESIMGEEKPNQKEKFTFKAERLRQFIPSTVPYEKTEDYVLKALEYYHRYQERQKERSQER